MGGPAARETRVKLLSSALVARETFVKPSPCPPAATSPGDNPAPATTQPRPATKPFPQPRGIARKPCPGLVRGYEPS